MLDPAPATHDPRSVGGGARPTGGDARPATSSSAERSSVGTAAPSVVRARRAAAPADLPAVPATDPRYRARRTARRRARHDAPLTVPELTGVTVREVALRQGTVRVREVGTGPTLLFVHGLLVDGRVWDGVAAALADRFRCVLPDLPLGSHRHALAEGADRAPEGIADLLEDLTVALDLADVTVVANDSGGAITQLWMDRGMARASRVVLTPCDCFDHFLPPAFRAYQVLARIPGVIGPVLAATRLDVVRQLPMVYGGLTHRRIDAALLDAWLAPAAADRGVQRDVVGFLRGISSRRLTAAEERLTAFDRPVLLAWAPEQAWFPLRHARRLQEILPDARTAVIRDAGAFVGLEQPRATADLVAGFAVG
ncbi:alpha/beta fold hydrolase [Patulibacter minatonensis]|uniref:alpha/beta fold hydrolase n=1 Tax=Patulibacter minatonensis TaxID=298163 RepID=UPI0006880DF0|nr:alpha/beta hydrolase [Patulibacter minatonensis]